MTVETSLRRPMYLLVMMWG